MGARQESHGSACINSRGYRSHHLAPNWICRSVYAAAVARPNVGRVICVLGVSKWLFGALLFAGFWNKKIGVLGFGGMRQGHEAKHKAQIPRDRERQPRSSGDDSPRYGGGP